MPIVTFLWVVGPLALVWLLMVYGMRRVSRREAHGEAVRFRGRTDEAGLASAMTDALTRMRGQELAQQARFAALNGFLHQVVESLPHGLFVLGRDGSLRVANTEALRWLGLPHSVAGQVLWTLDGTEPLRAVAQACLQADARRDASVVGPGVPGSPVSVTALPLRAADGDVDGVVCLVHVERVA